MTFKTDRSPIKTHKITRLERVREIRDCVRDLVGDSRRWSSVSEDLVFKIPGLVISYERAADFKVRPIGVSGIDIWLNQKVMNIEWNERDEVHVVSFKRGPWEEMLLSDWRTLVRAIEGGEALLSRECRNAG